MEHELSPEQARINMWKWQWRRRIAVAQGLYEAELVIRGGRVLNVFTEELIEADVAIDAGVIVGVGSFPLTRTEITLNGQIIAPSFIDAHIHTEASLLWMPRFAEAVVPHGTGLIVTDPHEMANVAGLDGICAMRVAAQGLPLNVRFTAPSCVPASAHESPGAEWPTSDIEEMLGWPETVGLGEMMNFPAVLAGEQDVADIFAAARGHRIDGHSPMMTGVPLTGYIAAGIDSDHESVTLEEAQEKLRNGLMIMIREGSSEKNLHELLPLVNDKTYPRICFASDDRDCHDLAEVGHVDDILRLAISGGLDPIRAIRMATWNAAQYWKLSKLGAVAPGYDANLVILDNLTNLTVEQTLFRGEVVAIDGQLIVDLPEIDVPHELLHTVNLAPVRRSQLQIAAVDARKGIEVIPGQIVTRLIEIEPTTRDDIALSDPTQDLLKTVSIERHHATGRIGIGFTRGFGLSRGAIASTVAHDAHNIIAVGVSDEDILAAVAIVAESQGGLAAVADGEVLGHIPLPIAGLMTYEPLSDVARAYDALRKEVQRLGCTLHDPFGTLAFLSLSVIPEARLTDRGLLDLTTSSHE
ncbi:MAG: adenine deaminase [Thermomicrobiales bacterium]|nr:adenine deaminase [Thermomicrobiales bacterium]MCO5217591.1 adenine deaminase [Thermomicrobiales bacterium]MCO5224103.1 adenine deaminase [Thermomicrobiales bacterium]MCO5226938.1 adenine deaminase [Thermomicrobiales bacterium]